MKLVPKLLDFRFAKLAALVGFSIGSLVGCGESDAFMAAREASYAPVATPGAFPRVTWFGVTTLLIDDGQTQVLIDGFFSRPEGSMLSRVNPNPRLAEAGAVEAYGLRPAGCRLPGKPLHACPLADRTGLSLVIPAHAHFDHVMDSPLIAGLTGALLLEAPSVQPISQATEELFGEAIGPIGTLPRDEFERLLSPDGLEIGNLAIRLIETPHIHTPASFLTSGKTNENFTFPAWKWEMQVGENYAVWIETEGDTILLVPSGGEITDELSSDRIHADTVFLGIGYTGRLDDQQWHELWEKAVEEVGASRVAPLHWDNMQGMLDGESLPNDLVPWELFWLNRIWKRLEESASKSGIELLHLRPGRALRL